MEIILKINWFNHLPAEAVRETDAPVHRSASGYGSRIPTRWQVRHVGRWRRVYAICWSNVASYYVRVRGARVMVDIYS